MSGLGDMVDFGELVRRAVKYLVEGIMVAIAAYAIPKKSLNVDEVMLIALTAAATPSLYLIHTFQVWRFPQEVERASVSARTSSAFQGCNYVIKKFNSFKLW